MKTTSNMGQQKSPKHLDIVQINDQEQALLIDMAHLGSIPVYPDFEYIKTANAYAIVTQVRLKRAGIWYNVVASHIGMEQDYETGQAFFMRLMKGFLKRVHYIKHLYHTTEGSQPSDDQSDDAHQALSNLVDETEKGELLKTFLSNHVEFQEETDLQIYTSLMNAAGIEAIPVTSGGEIDVFHKYGDNMYSVSFDLAGKIKRHDFDVVQYER